MPAARVPTVAPPAQHPSFQETSERKSGAITLSVWANSFATVNVLNLIAAQVLALATKSFLSGLNAR
jgi:hypothetical protein